jgi:hypothetical protein
LLVVQALRHKLGEGSCGSKAFHATLSGR